MSQQWFRVSTLIIFLIFVTLKEKGDLNNTIAEKTSPHVYWGTL